MAAGLFSARRWNYPASDKVCSRRSLAKGDGHELGVAKKSHAPQCMVASRGCWCIVLEPVQAPHSCQDMWVRSRGGAAGCDLPDPPSLHLACTTITTHSNSSTYMHEAPCYGRPRAPGSRPRALNPEPRASAPGPSSRALMHTYRHGCMYGWGVIHTHIHGCMHACMPKIPEKN